MRRLYPFAPDRELYLHQLEALRLSLTEGKSLVISAGTGSGKTECFLLPALAKLFAEAPSTLCLPGVRVLVIYPLNALVNNQINRLQAWLGTQHELRFALYTRRLPEKSPRPGAGHSPHHSWPACQVTDRQSLRRRPPHLLVTNFSMLEYMLLRPVDSNIFHPDFHRLHTVILDEAHVYKGGLAAEITLLLRRALERFGRDPSEVQFFATSATLGADDPRGNERLQSFGADLFSQPRTQVTVVRGRRHTPKSTHGNHLLRLREGLAQPSETKKDNLSLETLSWPKLRVVLIACGYATEELPQHLPSEVSTPAYLHQLFSNTPVMGSLREALHRGPLLAREALELLHGGDKGTTVSTSLLTLLRLALQARSEGGEVFLPLKVHHSIRFPSRLYTCVDPTCTERNLPRQGATWPWGKVYHDLRQRCGCGSPVGSLLLCSRCGALFLAVTPSQDGSLCPILLSDLPASPPALHLLEAQGPSSRPEGLVSWQGVSAGWRSREIQEAQPKARLWSVKDECPRCGAGHHGSGHFPSSFHVNQEQGLAVLVNALYPWLPVLEKQPPPSLPGQGRRCLTFSDSRQRAAWLAGSLEDLRGVLITRALILSALTSDEPSVDAAELRPLLEEAVARQDWTRVTELSRALNTTRGPRKVLSFSALAEELLREGFDFGHHPLARHVEKEPISGQTAIFTTATWALLRECYPGMGVLHNLEELALWEISFTGAKTAAPRVDGLDEQERADLATVVLALVRKRGCLRWPASIVRTGGFLADLLCEIPLVLKSHHKPEDRRVVTFLSPNPHNRWTDFVRRVLCAKNSHASVEEVLGTMWNWASEEQILVRAGGSTEGMVLDVPRRAHFTAATPAFRCTVCNRRTARSIAGVCPRWSCSGFLRPLDQCERQAELERFYPRYLRNPNSLLPMLSTEHTAQLEVENLEQQEAKFRAGEVNLLVCSTTMELGIDIGGLEAVVLTNTPPTPANYQQRAGRIGRRGTGGSLVTTVARNLPLDLNAFRQPRLPYEVPILLPEVQLRSKRIVLRHAFAFLLQDFFQCRCRLAPDGHNPMNVFGNVETFFLQPVEPKSVLDLDPAVPNPLVTVFLAELEARARLATPESERVLNRLVRDTGLEGGGLGEIFQQASATLRSLWQDLLRRLEVLDQERLDLENSTGRDEAAEAFVAHQRRAIVLQPLVPFLARGRFLPSYGFPLDVVHLNTHNLEQDRRLLRQHKQRKPTTEEAGLRLERSLADALDEYLPGRTVVADKRTYVSEGLQKHWNTKAASQSVLFRFFALCDNCGHLEHADLRDDPHLGQCKICDRAMPSSSQYLTPEGFATAYEDTPGWVAGHRPFEPRSQTTYYHLDAEPSEPRPFCLHGLDLGVGFNPQGTMLALSRGPDHEGYAVCLGCGRAWPEPLPEGTLRRPHKRLKGRTPCTSMLQRHCHLGLSWQTEVLSLRLLDPQAPLHDDTFTFTLAHAVRLGAARLLQLDFRELGVIVGSYRGRNGAGNEILLFDDVPGGAGYMEILDRSLPELFQATLETLDCPNPECGNVCSFCMLHHENQLELHRLDRLTVQAYLRARLG